MMNTDDTVLGIKAVGSSEIKLELGPLGFAYLFEKVATGSSTSITSTVS